VKPYVICLMAASVDGRILLSRWRPKGGTAAADRRAPVSAMTLQRSQVMEGGSLRLRYRLQNAASDTLEP
jgi:riboflavin biosynthesis pyrimidine reductase